MKLDILLRTCSRSALKRFIDGPKSEIALACFSSLLESIETARTELPSLSIKLHVFDDHSEATMVDFMQEALKTLPYPAQLIPLVETGNNASMKANLAYALAHCDDLVYFVEDDYIHTESAITEMLLAYSEFTEKRGKSVIISPCDHVTEYWLPDINDSERSACRVVMGARRHWRTTYGTPGTYLIDQRVLRTHQEVYEQFTNYDPSKNITEGTTINLIYKQEDCFSPIPSITAHVDRAQTPFFDHERLWQKFRPTHTHAK